MEYEYEKSWGGGGSFHLHGFNMVLGKHCWQFLNNHNSLVARVYKARYLSNCHLYKANRGVETSFVWSGIWEVKEALAKGYRWMGSGRWT